MAYEIATYSEEHEGAVAELERALWLDDLATNAAHLAWKYRATPLREHGFLFVALDGARVVGVRGLLAGRWQARRDDGAERIGFNALVAADLVIAPEHRNTGLYRQLTEGALARIDTHEYPLAFNFSAGPVNRVGSLVAGWRQAFAIERWVCDPRPGISAKVRGVANSRFGIGRDAVERFESIAKRDRDTRCGRVSIRHDPRPADMARLVARAAWDGRIRQSRDEDFFDWRFAGPLAVNRFVYCDDDAALRGYLVLQARRHRPGVIAIVDYEVESAEILAELIEAGTRWASGQRIELWADGMGTELGDRLHRLGFRRIEAAGGVRADGPALLIRRLDADAVQALETASGRRIGDHADWDLRPVYSDAY